MKTTNKKAAEIAPTISTASGKSGIESLSASSVAQTIESEKFSIEEACRISGVNTDYFIQFFLIRGYIKPEPYGYSATMLGLEKGCVVNDKRFNAWFTTESIVKVASAFAA